MTSSNWFEMRSRIRGCAISSSFAQGDRLRHELYIDSGEGDDNMARFEHFYAYREQFETAYGRPLEWEELPTRRACRIAEYKHGCSVTEENRYDEFIDWFLDAGTRLRRALREVPPPLSSAHL
jgi:hypothetical protein